MRSQIALAKTLTEHAGVALRYVKPHGALYNMACRDDAIALPLIAAVEPFGLALMALPDSRLQVLCAGRVRFIAEGFADRRYLPDGSLVPRSRPDAFVEDAAEAVRQAEWLIRERGVQTLCVHGDNPCAVEFVRRCGRRCASAGTRSGLLPSHDLRRATAVSAVSEGSDAWSWRDAPHG